MNFKQHLSKLHTQYLNESACFIIKKMDNTEFMIYININATFNDLYRLIDLKLQNDYSNELYTEKTKSKYIKRDCEKIINIMKIYNMKSINVKSLDKPIFKLYLNSNIYNKIPKLNFLK